MLKLLREEEYFIALMQEPYKYKGKLVKQPKGCTRIPAIDKYDQGARTAIYASESLGICELKALCTRDCSVGQLKINGKQTIVASVYLDIQATQVVSEALKNLIKYCKQKKRPLIIGVDTNAHSVLYGPDNNPRGDILEEFLFEEGLQVENDTNVPTFQVIRAGVEHALTQLLLSTWARLSKTGMYTQSLTARIIIAYIFLLPLTERGLNLQNAGRKPTGGPSLAC